MTTANAPSKFFTEANTLLLSVREHLKEAAEITPLPPDETGGKSLLGTSPAPTTVGSGAKTPPQDLGVPNKSNVKDTFDLFMASVIAGVVEAHKCTMKEAESLVYSTIDEMEDAGLVPHWPGENKAGDAYMAAFLGAAKTAGLHYVVMNKATVKWGKEETGGKA